MWMKTTVLHVSLQGCCSHIIKSCPSHNFFFKLNRFFVSVCKIVKFICIPVKLVPCHMWYEWQEFLVNVNVFPDMKYCTVNILTLSIALRGWLVHIVLPSNWEKVIFLQELQKVTICILWYHLCSPGWSRATWPTKWAIWSSSQLLSFWATDKTSRIKTAAVGLAKQRSKKIPNEETVTSFWMV